MNEITVNQPTREQKIVNLKEMAASLEVSIIDEAQAELSSLQKKYDHGKIPSDLSDSKNYKEVHNAIQTIKKPRIALEKSRKEVVTPLNDIVKKINAAAKPIKEAYLELQSPWETAKKDFDTAKEIREREERLAEEQRIENILAHIAGIKALPMSFITADSSAIGKAIKNLEEETPEYPYQEFEEKAQIVIKETLALLNEQYQQKVSTEQAEAAAAKIEAERAAEEKARQEAEKKAREALAKEQAATAKKLAEQQEEIDRQKAEIERAERERQTKIKAEKEAELAEKLKKEQAEAKAKAEIEKEKEIASRRAEQYTATIKNMTQYKTRESLLDAIIAGDIINVAWYPK